MVVVGTGFYVDIAGVWVWLLGKMLDRWSMFSNWKVALGFHPDGGGFKMGVSNWSSSVTWECPQLGALLGIAVVNNTGYVLMVSSLPRTCSSMSVCEPLPRSMSTAYFLGALRNELQKVRQTITIKIRKHSNMNKVFSGSGSIHQDCIASSSHMTVKQI